MVTIMFALILFLAPCFAFGDTEVRGDVSGEWTIEDAPFIVVGNVTIPGGESLTIDPGVIVRFRGEMCMLVYGTLTAVGTEEDSIYFDWDEEDERWRSVRLLAVVKWLPHAVAR